MGRNEFYFNFMEKIMPNNFGDMILKFQLSKNGANKSNQRTQDLPNNCIKYIELNFIR